MRIPILHGVIDRRILVNFRVDPEVLATLTPAPFRPKVVLGYGWVGICLIRLKHIRPRFVPAWLGMSSENAAHRMAVEWEANGIVREGFYIRRRDTNSWLNAFGGGRLFPGVHHHAVFAVRETTQRLEVGLRSDDGITSLNVRARVAEEFPSSSVFGSLAEASEFARAYSHGYSPCGTPGEFQGMELRCHNWQVEALSVDEVRSSYFEDETLFPKGSVVFDHALLMRAIEHEWHEQSVLTCGAEANESEYPEYGEPVKVHVAADMMGPLE